jgi:osmoprotectant transport system permease protein
MSLFEYLFDPANWGSDALINRLLLQHLFYTGAAVAIAALLAIPTGILIGHTRRGSFLVIGMSNAARALPSLGLLVLIVLLLGTGQGPIIAILAVLAIPPILTATAAGVQGADSEAVHAARALGMSERQVVAQVEWPLALPLVLSGLRSATLQVVSTATVAAFAAGGGLGQLLISGQASQNYSQMFAGAALVAVLAIVLDIALGGVGWWAGRKARPRRKTLSRTAVVPT